MKPRAMATEKRQERVAQVPKTTEATGMNRLMQRAPRISGEWKATPLPVLSKSCRLKMARWAQLALAVAPGMTWTQRTRRTRKTRRTRRTRRKIAGSRLAGGSRQDRFVVTTACLNPCWKLTIHLGSTSLQPGCEGCLPARSSSLATSLSFYSI
eukprot:symbB.v1.2.013398.t1/scaffold950.1/size149601/1